MGIREDIVAMAEGELGSTDWGKYLRFYGYDYKTDWCAAFVTWVFGQFGLNRTAVPHTMNCTPGRKWFRDRGRYQSPVGYIPEPGDLIYYDWDNDPAWVEHVGIVRYSDGTHVYTVEGNVNFINGVSRVAYKQRTLGYGPIDGYGRPLVEDPEPWDPDEPWDPEDPGDNPYNPPDEFAAWYPPPKWNWLLYQKRR